MLDIVHWQGHKTSFVAFPINHMNRLIAGIALLFITPLNLIKTVALRRYITLIP